MLSRLLECCGQHLWTGKLLTLRCSKAKAGTGEDAGEKSTKPEAEGTPCQEERVERKEPSSPGGGEERTMTWREAAPIWSRCHNPIKLVLTFFRLFPKKTEQSPGA